MRALLQQGSSWQSIPKNKNGQERAIKRAADGESCSKKLQQSDKSGTRHFVVGCAWARRSNWQSLRGVPVLGVAAGNLCINKYINEFLVRMIGGGPSQEPHSGDRSEKEREEELDLVSLSRMLLGPVWQLGARSTVLHGDVPGLGVASGDPLRI